MTPTVFLDLDGTLTDPKPGITRSVIYALEQLGLSAPAEDELTWVIGPPLIESFARLGVADPEAALALYRDRYGTIGLFENRPFPGIDDVLTRLSARYRLCLATAKPLEYATRITAKFGLDRHLFSQFGPDMDGTLNDKGELLAFALEELGERADNAVMVGDRHHDIDAAGAVGMASVAVTWGFGGPGEFVRADAICEHRADLPDVIAAVLDG